MIAQYRYNAHINGLPWGYTPGTLKKHDSNALIPPPSPGKCVSQTAPPPWGLE